MVGHYAVGMAPAGIAFDGVNIWVANSGSGTVSKLNATGATLDTVNVGLDPDGIAFDGEHIVGFEQR